MLRIVEYCFRHYSVIVDALPKYLNSHYLLIFPLQQSDIQALGAIYKFFKPQKMEKMPNTGNRSSQLNSQFVLHYLTSQHLNGPAVKQIWKRRFFLWEADGPSVWDRSRWTHGGNPGQRTLKLQLAKGKKINTMKTLGQIPPITQVKWSLHVVLDRAENRICSGHWVFSHLFTGQEREWQAGCTRVRKVTLETIQNEWVCIPAKPALFASGEVWAASVLVLRGIFVHKTAWFALLHPTRGCHWTPRGVCLGRAGDTPVQLYLIQQEISISSFERNCLPFFSASLSLLLN